MNVRSPRTLAAWTAAGAAGVLLTAGALQAGAATTAPSADPSTSAAAEDDTAADTGTDAGTDAPAEEGKRRGGPGGGGPRGALHGEFVTGTAETGYVTVAVQRGEAGDVSATSVTVTSVDGFAQTWAVDADTEVRVDGEEATVADLADGDTVRISGESADGALTATRIGAGERPEREGRGGHGGRGEHGPKAEGSTDEGATVEGSSLPVS